MKIGNGNRVVLNNQDGAWFGLERYYSILYHEYLLRPGSSSVTQVISHIKRKTPSP